MEHPWQHAVFTRPVKGRPFTFSHIVETTITKAFPASLKASELFKVAQSNQANIKAFRTAPLLTLVTDSWAQHITYQAYLDCHGEISKIPLAQYDHLERLSLSKKHLGECSELEKGYRALQSYSSLTSYTKGESHTWAFESSIPMLSTVVVLPKILTEEKLKIAMGGFQRALKKSMHDSLIFIGETQYKEESWERKKEPVPLSHTPSLPNASLGN